MPARILAAAAAIVAVGLAAASAQAQPTVFQGELAGAPYEIIVPESWNGTLVVLAHGYRDKADHPGEVDDRRALDGGMRSLANSLAGLRYAVAATAYQDNGWAVKESIQDITALRTFFDEAVGQPETALLAGFSLGSFVTATLAERGAGLFDGFLPACGVLAGSTPAWDVGAGGLLAYQQAFGAMPEAWGTAGDADDDVDFETEVLPVVVPQLLNPANFGKWEFVRLLAGVRGPIEALDPALYPAWAITDFFFFTEARGELERRAGGPFVQNLDHTYWLAPGEQLYLMALGYDPTVALAAMNTSARYSGSRSARNYVQHYATFSGRIKNPVLAIHTKWDTLVPVSHEQRYAETVAAAGRSDLLRQAYSNGIGHCQFGPELVGAILLVEGWAKTGTPPTAAMLAGAGLDPSFAPPEWPQP